MDYLTIAKAKLDQINQLKGKEVPKAIESDCFNSEEHLIQDGVDLRTKGIFKAFKEVFGGKIELFVLIENQFPEILEDCQINKEPTEIEKKCKLRSELMTQLELLGKTRKKKA